MSSHHIVDADDLKAKLTEAGNKLVVIDFFATWCGPCKMIAPILDKISEELKDFIVVLKVDVNKCKSIAEEYKITAMPTFLFIKDGEKVGQFVGACEENIRKYIQKYK